MGHRTSIEWTNSTWKPTTGCTKVSPGCRNCYAEKLAVSLQNRKMPKYRNGFKFTLHEEYLELPLHWRKPRRIFVDSMSDLFHEDMPDEYLRKCFDVMERANWHTYQILTKRPDSMLEFSLKFGRFPDHIWMGTSVESSPFKSRIDTLRRAPAKIRFVSFEPLLDSMHPPIDLSGIRWVIAGGESGPNYRPVKTEWIREIRDECLAQGVAFFFKQYGGLMPTSGGRTLDRRTWNEYPNLDNAPEEGVGHHTPMERQEFVWLASTGRTHFPHYLGHLVLM